METKKLEKSSFPKSTSPATLPRWHFCGAKDVLLKKNYMVKNIVSKQILLGET